MSRTNAYLLNSLMWNLREITNLIEIIKSRVGDVICSSWRHPLMSCGELDVLQLLEDKDCDRYAYLLELTFDRLIYILNLMVKYLESCDALSKFKTGKNVERPRNLSMASILYMIWDRIQFYCETMKKSTVNCGKNLCDKRSTNSFTQSDFSSIPTCSSCDLAQDLVTQIVLKMEHYFGDNPSISALRAERKLMKDKLIGTSNSSAMMAWVNAAVKDLNTICDEAQKFKSDNRKLKSRIDSDEASLTAKLKKRDEESMILQKMCKENEERLKFLEMEVRVLREEKRKHQNELIQLGGKNSELTKSLTETENMKKILEKNLIMKERMEQDWKTKLEDEVKMRECAQKELENVKTQMRNMENQIDEANARCLTHQANAEQLGEKLKLLNDENERLLSSLTQKQKDMEKLESKFLEAFPDISDEGKNKYKGTGDPSTDMRHQIEANKLRISQLTLHNENLTQTISRIEAIRK